MNIALEKKNILQWIQKLDDEKIIEKIIEIIEENQISTYEHQLI